MRSFALQRRLLRMWLRNPQRLVTALIVGCTTTGWVLLYVALNSFALSGPQLAERSLGGHDYKLTTPVGAPGTNATTSRDVGRGLASAGGVAVTLQTTSFDFVVDGGRTTGLATGLQNVVLYSQLESGAMPSRFVIMSGRFPTSPTEIALSEHLSAMLGSPSNVSVFAGTATLRVVGRVRDTFATDSLRALGGPGLWQGLPRNVADSFPAASASLEVSWNDLPPDEAVPVISAVTDTPVDQLLLGLETRSHYYSTSQRSLTARTPAMFTYPSLGTIALATIAMTSFVIARIKPEIVALARIGIPKGGPWQAAMATLAALLTGSVVLGAGVGAVAGWAIRLVIPSFLTQPIGPYPPLLHVAASMLGAAIATGGVCLAAWSRPAPPLHVGDSRWLARGRHIGVAGLAVWCLTRLHRVHRIEDALAMGVAVTAIGLLLIPELVRAAVRLLGGRSLDQRIASRLLQNQSGTITTLAVFLCACLSLPSSLGILSASVQQSTAAQSVLPPGQLRLQDAAGHAPEPSLVATVERETGLSNPVSVRMLAGVLEGSRSNAMGVMIVDQIDDVERLNGAPLDAHASQVLASGGLVDFSGAEESMAVAPDDQNPTLLPTAHVAFQPAWARLFAGVILEDTRKRLNAAQYDSSLVYTDVSEKQIAAAKGAVQTAGGDPRTVSYHVTPPPSKIPWEWWMAIGGLAVIGLAATFLVARRIGANLRQHSAQFLAIGLPPKTTITVLLMQLATIIAVVLPLTLIVGVLPTAALAAVSRGMSLHVPTGMVLSSIIALLLVIAASAMGAIGGVRARDRAVSTLI